MAVECSADPFAAVTPRASLAEALLGWYDGHARNLPWRAPPGFPPPDPYRVWLAEVMLQQTTVAAVAPRYQQFLHRWPRIEDLAAAAPEDLMSAWAGLGYYARARNLQACAQEVVARGGFPRSARELQQLPGIGPYTAAAIAAIAFGEPVAVADGNIERVMARVCALRTPPPALMQEVRDRLQPLLPTGRPGDFAQAMMDLGAMICRPEAPQCDRCPIAGSCRARELGVERDLPLRRAKPLRQRLFGTAWWIEVAGEVAVEQRPRHGLLGGMQGFPGTAWSGEAAAALPFPGPWQRSPAPVRHLFTHIDLRLEVAAIRLDQRPERPYGLKWVPVAGLSGLPSLYRKVAEAATSLLKD